MSEALSNVSTSDANRVEHGLTCSILSLVNMIVRSSLSTVQTTGRSTPRYLSYEAKSLVVSAESRNSTAGLVSSSSQPSVIQRTYLQPPLYACQCQLNGLLAWPAAYLYCYPPAGLRAVQSLLQSSVPQR